LASGYQAFFTILIILTVTLYLEKDQTLKLIKNFNLRFTARLFMLAIITISSVLIFWVRNIIEKGSLFYPMKSSTLNNEIVLSNIGSEIPIEYSTHITQIFYQYLYSSLLVYYNFFSELIINKNVPTFDSDSRYYRTFVYDNRLGGFGVAIIVYFLWFGFLVHKKDRIRSVVIPLLIVGISILLIKLTIHPRYVVGVPLFFLLISASRIDILTKRFTKKMYPLYLMKITVICIIFLTVTITGKFYLDRVFPNGIQLRPNSFYSTIYEDVLNKECGDSYFIGGLQWYQPLWGRSGCGRLNDALLFEELLERNNELSVLEARIFESRVDSMVSAFISSDQSVRTIICTKAYTSLDYKLSLSIDLLKFKSRLPNVCDLVRDNISREALKNKLIKIETGEISIHYLDYEYYRLYPE
jgi:hypothetical protein